MDPFKKAVIDFLAQNTNLETDFIESKLEVPPDQKLGDFAFPCFVLAKEMKMAPPAIAQQLCEKFETNNELKECKATGPYLNFFVNRSALASKVLGDIQTQQDAYGAGSNGKKFMLEFPSPNSNKPLHLGHVKLMIYGCALANLLEKAGNESIVVNLVNDRGIHICKSMLAYQKFGNGETPESSGMKGDYFVGKYYVMFAQKLKEDPTLEAQAQEMLNKWEDGDEEIRTLWEIMNGWALKGMEETYETFGFKTQKNYMESSIYLDGKKLVLDGYEKGILKKDENGNIYSDLEEYDLTKKVLLRADGTTIYSTQDLALAHHKYTDFKFDKSLYLVGTEQNYYLQQVFKTIEVLGFEWGSYCEHVKSGMVYLPTGRMKSREGTVVEADGLVRDMKEISRKALVERYTDLDEQELEKRSFIIGMGALRFFFLKYDPARDFTFDPQGSISFDGETGPYVQYTHARICSILRKVNSSVDASADVSPLTEESEKKVLALLDSYSATIQEAAKHYNTSKITRYLLDLSQAFNEFYHAHKVITDDEALSAARLLLCDCTRIVLKDAMGILNIVAPEVM